jgi:hypothetical protein
MILRTMRTLAGRAVAAGLLALTFSQASPVLAHGDLEGADAFHEHLDDYQTEVQSLTRRADELAAEGEFDEMPAFIEAWEEVEVHAAVESQASELYAGIWQGLIALNQTMEAGDREAARAAAERFKGALWQGYGALRYAAARMEAGDEAASATAQAEPMSGAEAVAAIIEELRAAVDTWESGDTAAAERQINRTYMQRFEYLEGDLIERDPELVSRLEKDFNATLPLKLQEGAEPAAVEAVLDSMVTDLNRAARLLEAAEKSRSEVF